MKIIKLSTTTGSFCSTDVKAISKRIKEQIENSIKDKQEKKFEVEVFDIDNGNINLSSKYLRIKNGMSNINLL
ncbi:MAG: hypothetical protein NTX22_07115 [Ignavibacteriales bacterium]|nr:hypothetical protein [Ignavibacteriales bacterium]